MPFSQAVFAWEYFYIVWSVTVLHSSW